MPSGMGTVAGGRSIGEFGRANKSSSRGICFDFSGVSLQPALDAWCMPACRYSLLGKWCSTRLEAGIATEKTCPPVKLVKPALKSQKLA